MQNFYPLVSSSQTDFEAIYNQAPCGLLTFRADGTIVHINQTLLVWLDADIADVIYGNFTNLLDNGGRLYYQLFVQPLLRMNNEVREISFQIETGKSSFPCLFSAKQFKNEEEELLYSATIYKVADRKKYESELLKQKQQAETETVIKTETLKEVAFDQSHLVRAPLANILGLISLLDDMDTTDEVSDMIKLLRTSAANLDREVIKLADKLDV